jgi:hypothetical protein
LSRGRVRAAAALSGGRVVRDEYKLKGHVMRDRIAVLRMLA